MISIPCGESQSAPGDSEVLVGNDSEQAPQRDWLAPHGRGLAGLESAREARKAIALTEIDCVCGSPGRDVDPAGAA
jgi:hypothetical protein